MTFKKKDSLPELLHHANQLPFGYADGDGIEFEPYDVFPSAEETTH